MADLLARTNGLPERHVAAGQSLITEGGSSGQLLVVVSGAFEVRKGAVVLAVVDEPGTCLGELSVLLDQPHHATVVAITDSVVRVAADGAAFLRSDAEAALIVASILAHRLDVVNSYLTDIRAQYADASGHLGLIHEVLADLASSKPRTLELGSQRAPDPLY